MLKRICKILNNIIICILIVFAIIMFVPKLLGWQNLVVLSGSMEPNISVGSMIIVSDIEPETLKPGDVITFQVNDSTLVTHRVVSNNIELKQVITKGDANDVNDATPVEYSHIIGKLFISIPFLGYLSISMQSTFGIAIICTIVFVLILLNYLPEIFNNKTAKKE